MASADLSYVFQRVQSCNRQSRVGQIMREVLPGILLSLEKDSELHRDTGCILADIGGLLVNILAVASKLAETLVDGDYISKHVTQIMSLIADEPDLRSTDYLDDKHEALEKITSHILKAKAKACSTWKKTPPVPPTLVPRSDPSPPSRSNSLPIREPTSSSRFYTESPSSLEPAARSVSWETPSAESDLYEDAGRAMADDPFRPNTSSSGGSYGGNGGNGNYYYEQDEYAPSLEQLSNRGTGAYRCPHGTSCKKGGVSSDGQLRTFTRNSDFKTHMLKHEKVYKCELAGCPNRKGFARPDQLRRHQQTVKHGSR